MKRELSYREQVLICLDRSGLSHEQMAAKIPMAFGTFEIRLANNTIHEYPRDRYKMDLLLKEWDVI